MTAIARALVVLAALAGPAAADSFTDHYDRGLAAFNLGNYPEAIKEFEAAHKVDPSRTNILFNLGHAYRRAGNPERALFFYARYLEANPNAGNKEEVLELQVALHKALADKAAADRAREMKAGAEREQALRRKADDAERARAELAAKADGASKRVRVALDAGLAIVHLKGVEEDPRAPSLAGRLAVSWIKRVGATTLDVGGAWTITAIPYTEMLPDGATKPTSMYFTQILATAAASRTIAGPVWIRVGLGLGGSAFGNLQDGNPVAPGMQGRSDIRAWCARSELVLGYRVGTTIDFTLGLAAGSISSQSRKAAPELDNVTTFETGTLGVNVKL